MSTKKLLLVEADDFYDEIIETFVKLFLQDHVRREREIVRAVAALTGEKWDIVLLDLDIGVADALELAFNMGNSSDLKAIPILALAQDDKLRERALGAGCSAFLAKPFKVRELEALIHRLLGT